MARTRPSPSSSELVFRAPSSGAAAWGEGRSQPSQTSPLSPLGGGARTAAAASLPAQTSGAPAPEGGGRGAGGWWWQQQQSSANEARGAGEESERGEASERRGGVRRAVRGGRYRMGRGRGGEGGGGTHYRFATRMPASLRSGAPTSVLTPTSGENERIVNLRPPARPASTLGKSRVAVVRRRSRSRSLRLARLTPVPPHVSRPSPPHLHSHCPSSPSRRAPSAPRREPLRAAS